MGWTYTYKSENVKAVDFIRNMSGVLEWRTDAFESSVIDSAQVGNVLYFAVEHKFPNAVSFTHNRKTYKAGDREVFAVIVLTRKDRDPDYNFGYKDMDEGMHPFYYDCPKRILDKLTPTDDKQANAWREACSRKAERSRSLNSLKTGDMIYFKEPMNFTCGWGSHATFRVARLGKKLAFEFLTGGLCRITKERLLRGGWVAFRGDDVVADFMEDAR